MNPCFTHKYVSHQSLQDYIVLNNLQYGIYICGFMVNKYTCRSVGMQFLFIYSAKYST